MATPATEFTLHATAVETDTTHPSFDTFGKKVGGIFQIRLGMSARDAIDVAQSLLAAVSDMANDCIEHGNTTTAHAHLTAFALGAVLAIHSSIGFEV